MKNNKAEDSLIYLRTSKKIKMKSIAEDIQIRNAFVFTDCDPDWVKSQYNMVLYIGTDFAGFGNQMQKIYESNIPFVLEF